MTRDQIGKVVSRYMTVYIQYGYAPKENHGASTPNECVDHAMWMCEEIVKLLVQNDVPKALRWLGFVEGVLFTADDNSLGELKEMRSDDHSRFSRTGGLH